MMIRKLLPAVALALATLTGCAEDPCLKLPPPTPAMLEAAKIPNVEVEQVTGTYDCELIDGRWNMEDD